MAKDENYFSWDNFDEIAEIDMHLTFLDEIITKYDFSDGVKSKIQNQLDDIKKAQDKNLIKICVIGESSTGKSAFINAFIKMELLESSALQGTTKMCTFLEYSPDYKITLELSSGDKEEEIFANIDDLRDKVSLYTTSKEEEYPIKKITIGIPSSMLSAGMQIIDTPGIDSGVDWNYSDEGENIRNTVDALIILTDANKAMPQSLVDFIKRKISNTGLNCIFMATKCDVIHNNGDKIHGIDYVLDYIKRKIKTEFNVDEGIVLPYASLDVMDDFLGEENPIKELVDLSLESEDTIKRYASKREFFSRKGKQLGILKEAYCTIADELKSISDSYNKDIDYITEQENIDLYSSIQGTLQQEKEDILESIKAIRIETADNMYSEGLEIIRNIIWEIDEMVEGKQSLTTKQVAGFCVEKFPKIMSELFNYYNECKSMFEQYRNTLKNNISDMLLEKSIDKENVPSVKECAQRILPAYTAHIWNQKNNELYYKIIKVKKIYSQTNVLYYVLVNHLEEIVFLASDIMENSKNYYFKEEKGVYDLETKQCCDMNEKTFKTVVKKWFANGKTEEINYKKEQIETIMDDEIRIKNRMFSVESCSEQLENRRKGNKNSGIYD